MYFWCFHGNSDVSGHTSTPAVVTVLVIKSTYLTPDPFLTTLTQCFEWTLQPNFLIIFFLFLVDNHSAVSY